MIYFGSLILTSTDMNKREFYDLFGEFKSYLYASIFKEGKSEISGEKNRRIKKRFVLKKKELWFVIYGNQRP